jgi:hypothetical protein
MTAVGSQVVRRRNSTPVRTIPTAVLPSDAIRHSMRRRSRLVGADERRRVTRHRRRSAATVLLGAGVLMGATAPPTGASVAIARPVFRIADARIAEASGIAPGLASPGVVYVQNDSGDTNRFFALDAHTGATAATVTVTGARNIDWEDIAAAPDAAGQPSVWLADIGDNSAVRNEIQVYRVAEPRVSATARDRRLRTRPADVWRLRYPGGPVDAESLAVGPDGTAYVMTKQLGTSTVLRLPARPDPSRVQLLSRVGQLNFAPTGTTNAFGLAGQLTATGASISAGGDLLVVRTYADAYLWRLAGGNLAAAVRRPPVRLALPQQPQGEGICVRGGRLLLTSEGQHSAVLAVAVPDALLPIASTTLPPTSTPSGASAPSSSSTSPTALPSAAASERRSSRWLFPVLLAGAAAAVGATWLLLRSRPRSRPR